MMSSNVKTRLQRTQKCREHHVKSFQYSTSTLNRPLSHAVTECLGPTASASLI